MALYPHDLAYDQVAPWLDTGLSAIEELYTQTRYEVIVWLNARDVDLQLSGPKFVRPLVSSPDDTAKLYTGLVLPPERIKEKWLNPR